MAPQTGYNCLFSNLCDLSKFYGCALKEYEIFFLANGLFCYYVNEKDRQTKEIHKNIIINDYQSIVKNYAKEINVQVIVKENTKALTYLIGLKEAICKDNPVIILINSKCLTYQTPPAYLTEVDAMHAVIVYGFDDEKKEIYLYDSYVYDQMQNPIPYYTVKLSYNVFLENVYLYSRFDFSHYKKLDKTYKANRVLSRLHCFIKDNSHKGLTKGIEAFRNCIMDIKLLKGINREEAKKEFNELFYLFKVQFSFVNHYILEYMHDSDMEDTLKKMIINRIKILIKDWDKYLMKMLVGSYMDNNRVIDRIIESGLQLANKQQDLITEVIGSQYERINR
ncbi:hypothetical protein HZI73_05815 [Vallitalea pronyensis]|uniref:Butirosin biosynthesis protein H N-terminal domain-containing protein n=1 Tax=Vallitalea pronyensis TaxID=1348613 RepID=A0A8J8MIC9_9FIRM|nr:BtrH N-terminal domain-containing protein [Vallitalea pronyensis]QUI21843.1 hypothetical protein HZI73_05815 [Vallitalea pronyensis]